VLFFTKYTHPTLICRGTDAHTDGRTHGRKIFTQYSGISSCSLGSTNKRCRRSLARPNWTTPEYHDIDHGVLVVIPWRFCVIAPIAFVEGMGGWCCRTWCTVVFAVVLRSCEQRHVLWLCCVIIVVEYVALATPHPQNFSPKYESVPPTPTPH